MTFAPVAALLTALAFCAFAVAASAKPIKLVLSSNIGWEVDKTAKANVCSVGGTDECQLGVASGQPGGFYYPKGVAFAPSGDIYVTEVGNSRVQELTPSDEFVLMFGKDVNETTGGDVCTEQEVKASGVKCKAGVESASAGGLMAPGGVAVEPGTGDVYVVDSSYRNPRIDKFTAQGSFIWTAGKGVDETTGGDLCTAVSKDVCRAGLLSTPESKEACAFNFFDGGDTLAIGGPAGGTIYVADAHRVQELDGEGHCTGEIAVLPAISKERLQGVAVSAETADVVLSKQSTIRKYALATGAQTGELNVASRSPGEPVAIEALALDSAGHLAVSAAENESSESPQFGVLYEAASGRPLTEFAVPGERTNHGLRGVAFNAADELFGATEQEIHRYDPVPVGELTTGGASCAQGPVQGSSDTFTCALRGEANPYTVPGTEAWFEWGLTCALGTSTAPQALATVEAPLAVQAQVEGARPNQQFCFRLAAVDENVHLPEQLNGAEHPFSTPTAPPRLVGEPSATFVTNSSAVLNGQLNPENMSTTYEFQYAKACEAGPPCPGLGELPEVGQTTSGQSARYGKLGVAFQASGLQPATAYRYRLVAVNEKGEQAVNEAGGAQLPEGTFTTAPAPLPEALTGAVAEVGKTSATIFGAVDPGGLPATYSFELGIYEGGQTVYGVVFSGPVPPATEFEQESLALTGLQPGTTYAYRIAVSSGYIAGESHTAYGAAATFTTQGLPSVLSAPAAPSLLTVPNVAFPKTAALAKAKHRAKKHKRGKQRRASDKKRKSSKTKKGNKR